MINVVKYALEGLAVALATNIISHGKTSFGEVFLMAISAMSVFLLLDVFAPLTAAGARHGAGFGLGLQMVGVGGAPAVPVQAGGATPQAAPDMCGGSGLLQALQTAGGPVDQPPATAPVSSPYKMVSCDYGAGVLLAGFNENADGYNVDKINNLAAF